MRLNRVTRRYGNQTVLSDVSLTVSAGERVCLLGRSGIGKTTVLRLLMGLEKPDAGTVEGGDRLRFSAVFQENRLLPWYTAEQNLRLFVGDDAPLWLSRVQLTEAAHKRPEELSGGMKRRLALARALGQPSDAVLLDEPFAGLDSVTADRMTALIDQSLGQRSLVLVTHDESRAQALGCSIIRLGT